MTKRDFLILTPKEPAVVRRGGDRFLMVNGKRWRRLSAGASKTVFISPNNRYVLKVADKAAILNEAQVYLHATEYQKQFLAEVIWVKPFGRYNYLLKQEYVPRSRGTVPNRVIEEAREVIQSLRLDWDVTIDSRHSRNCSYVKRLNRVKIFDMNTEYY